MRCLRSSKGHMEYAVASIFVVSIVSLFLLILYWNPIQEEIEYEVAFDLLDYSKDVVKSNQELPREGHLVPYDKDGTEMEYTFVKNGLELVKQYNVDLTKYNYMGIDTSGKRRPVNAFFVGYSPLETDSLWAPMVVLSKRIKYASDDYYYGGKDTWQTSRYTYRVKRGDCEDHAILLADWLIELGFDARVVIGSYYFSGHAWVVVIHEGRSFIIESVVKDDQYDFKVIRFSAAYLPKEMFNRDYYWRNEGAGFLTPYDSPRWRLMSRFVEDI